MTSPNQEGSATIDWRSIRTLHDTLRIHLAEVESGTHLDDSGGLLIESAEDIGTKDSRRVRSQWKSTVVASANKLADLLAIKRIFESPHVGDFDIVSDDPKTRQKSQLVRQASTIETTASDLLSNYDTAAPPHPAQKFELLEADRSHGVFSEQPPLPGTLITLVGENGGYMVKVTRVELGPNNRLQVVATQDVTQSETLSPHMTLSIE
ncbi:MAG: hypothetical protein ACRBN8_43280 [Nannocystales bacterium]